ncbi:DUF3515 domain-containing protein [Mycolicibacterium sp. XJ1819]
MAPDSHDGPPRAVLITAVVVAVGSLIAILGIAVARQRSPADRPVAVVTVAAPDADSGECRSLVDALPDDLGDFGRAPVAEPAPVGAAAWRAQPDGEPVILRCGLDRPAEFVVGTALQVVDDVQWFRVAEAGPADDPDAGRATWFAVDRPVYVALTLPSGSGPTPIQVISQTIAQVLPAKPIDPAPVG